MDLKAQAEIVSSHEDLVVFIKLLEKNLKSDPESWVNGSLPEFLEALSAWVEDMDGYYLNNKLPIPDHPTWKTIAEMLLAAKFYE
ncbi:DUF7660 family protein [Methylobacter sp. sgz302048]|jgi:hypothetical protein|uniref:DUF7660 family protein n=1 Tax=Methylobacter sp. sgz302048 TaxID=3455945 RepID=UPI003F9F008E